MEHHDRRKDRAGDAGRLLWQHTQACAGRKRSRGAGTMNTLPFTDGPFPPGVMAILYLLGAVGLGVFLLGQFIREPKP